MICNRGSKEKGIGGGSHAYSRRYRIEDPSSKGLTAKSVALNSIA
jgi:hypothetical protein